MSERSEFSSGRGLAERLHDGPLQLIAALRLKLTALAEKGAADSDDLSDLADLAVEVQEELGKLVQILADPAVDDRPELSVDLCERLEDLCAKFSRSSGIECQLMVIPSHTRLPSLASVIVYRAIRELLTNVRKHSGASNVEVSSSMRADGSIVFSVRDDGVGIDAEPSGNPSREAGFGLWSIGQRLQEIGAHLASENDNGLCVHLVLPAVLAEDDQGSRTASVAGTV